MTDATAAIKEPPSGLLSSARYLGPGLILSAAIVGSGELIATTTLGQKAGFSLLWVILLGCLVKVFVQLEYGRYCITHGLPTYQAWNRVGRVKPKAIHWTVYIGVLFMLANMSGQAGVLGGAAQVGHHAFSVIPLPVYVLLLILVLGLLVFHGRYGPVEGVATVLNGLFLVMIFFCVFQVQRTDAAFTLGDIASGFNVRLPAEYVALALSAFGITGVAAGEIAMYPYWCLEKGYARWTGPRDDSPAWARRARGWIRVMTIDAVVSMVVYTLATCAFYILGATILHQHPEAVRDKSQFVPDLSALFTAVLGEGSRSIFMLCAFTVLFSTIFANTAAFSRMWTDFFGLCRWIDWHDARQRGRSLAIMAWIFPAVCGMVYLFVGDVLVLVTIMGICNATFLVVVAYQAIIFKYRHADPRLKPSPVYDVAFWISLVSIGYVVVFSSIKVIEKIRSASG